MPHGPKPRRSDRPRESRSRSSFGHASAEVTPRSPSRSTRSPVANAKHASRSLAASRDVNGRPSPRPMCSCAGSGRYPLAAGHPLQALAVEDDDGVALEAEQTVIHEQHEELVHALAGRPDHRRQNALGQQRVEPSGTFRSDTALRFGPPRQARGETAGYVEQAELLDT